MERRLILYIATSLDGYIAGEKGKIDWLFSDQDYGYKEFYASVDTVIMGRKTYDVACSFEEVPYQRKECVVFSKKKTINVADHVKVITTNIHSFVRQLKNKKGKNIWLVGGSEIVHELIELIDDYLIFVHPIILGKGIPLFKKNNKRIQLKCVGTKSFSSGLVELRYSRNSEAF